MYKELMIGEITINRSDNDLYSLNDLHKAAGGEQKHRPKYWLSNQQTQDLIATLQTEGGIPFIEGGISPTDGGMPVSVIKGGLNQGTFVCRELVYAYATWISPVFHIQVIRGYDKWFTGPGRIRLTGEKKPSLSKMIEFGRSSEKMMRIAKQSAISTDLFIRAQSLEILKNYCEQTGTVFVDPALIGTRTINDPPDVSQFWDTFESINGGVQHLFNHSSCPDQEIAIKLSQIYGHCQTQGISFPEHNILRPLLLKSERYRYAGNAPIWSRLWRKTIRCMVFTKN